MGVREGVGTENLGSYPVTEWTEGKLGKEKDEGKTVSSVATVGVKGHKGDIWAQQSISQESMASWSMGRGTLCKTSKSENAQGVPVTLARFRWVWVKP